jgi:hypothetical protein
MEEKKRVAQSRSRGEEEEEGRRRKDGQPDRPHRDQEENERREEKGLVIKPNPLHVNPTLIQSGLARSL